VSIVPNDLEAESSFELDLPDVVAPDFPVPVVMADLPSIAVGLPVSSGGLPEVAVQPPVTADARPIAAAEGAQLNAGMGSINLPTPAESLPRPTGANVHLPAVAETLPRVVGSDALASTSPPSWSDSGHFGEIELPGETTATRPSSAPIVSPELNVKARMPSVPPPHGSVVRRDLSASAGGGMSFGEVELAASDAGTERDISVVAPLPATHAAAAPSATESASEEEMLVSAPAATGAARTESLASRRRHVATAPRQSIRARLAIASIVAAVLGGTALELTPYGAFGYLVASDWVRSGAYDRATRAAVVDTEKRMGEDTYDTARNAVDSAAASHSLLRRDRSLTAYAALVDFELSIRFGVDAQRQPRGKQLLDELPAKDTVPYRTLANAAQIANGGDTKRALAALDGAERRPSGDPIEVAIAVLRGELQLAAKNGDAALRAFRDAERLAGDARTHYGLARAYDMLGDTGNARTQISAALATSPDHAGALILRARLTASEDQARARAIEDLDRVLTGPSRAKASPRELSRAYALRAHVDMRSGKTREAREAFVQSLHLDPRDSDALCGEGRLFLLEARPTEALARFDSALQIEPDAVDAIVGDAEAKMLSERPAEAKQQLVDARARFPRNSDVAMWLGKAEERVGSKDNAQSDYRAAISLVEAKRSDAVAPYVALSELFLSRGQYSDAVATLRDAGGRLSPSVALDCAFGEVAEQQGDFPEAIARYRSAVARDPQAAQPRFQLAVVLRKSHQLAEARAELDRVTAIDADFPGLMIERGQLFEDLGEIGLAVEQFQLALAKAPDDADLQLRVGSVLVTVGRADEGLAMLRKVLDKRPTNAEAHHFVGRALMDQGPGHEIEALRYLKRAVDLDPNRAEYHVYVAWAANEIMPPQIELVRDEVARALDLDKRNPEAYWQRGILERIQGAVDDAVRDEKHALELRPSRYEAHAVLAECYEDKNEEGAAVEQWQLALAGQRSHGAESVALPHPYWQYKLGRLLFGHGKVGAALPILLAAANSIEHQAQRPGWRASLYFMTAEAFRIGGRTTEALEWYRRFFDVAPINSPDRLDAQLAISRITGGRDVR